MYKPDRKDKYFFLITFSVASIIGWYFLNKVRPTLIEASCSDIAEASSRVYSGKRSDDDPYFHYENIKARCLEDIKYNNTPPIAGNNNQNN